MNRLLRTSGLLALLIALGLAPARAGEIVELGPHQIVNGYGLVACAKSVQEGKAAVLFGMIVKPKGAELSYVVIVKCDNKTYTKVASIEDDKKAETTDSIIKLSCVAGIRVGTAELTLKYAGAINMDADTAEERLEVDGARVDFTKGRVLLVDLSADKPTWRQTNIKLPSAPDLTRKKNNSKEVISKTAQEISRRLAEKSTAAAAYVFAAELEAKAAKVRQGYIDFLKEEGYVPRVLPNGHVMFKKEGKTYVMYVEREDPTYFCIEFPGFWKFTDDDRDKVLQAADFANSRNKVGRVYTQGNIVSASVDCFLGTPDQYKPTFARSLIALDAAAVMFSAR